MAVAVPPSSPSPSPSPFSPSSPSPASPSPSSASASAASSASVSAAAPAPKVRAETHRIDARDGVPLAATLFLPQDGAPERVIIIGCATAVRRGFYEPYARYLAASGCAALTFDYRGIGGSLSAPIREVSATIRDWGELDYPAVIDAMAARFPDLPLQLVGHSVGGQLLGLLPNHHKITSACTVAAQHGYWRRYPWRQALSYALMWYGVMPTLAHLLSYFPSKRFKLGEDLPKGVALQWARWARSRHYMIDAAGEPLHQGFAAYQGALLAYSFADDVRAPERCVRALHQLFTHSNVEHRHVDPRAMDVGGIGHVGFFRAQFKHSLWRESLDWLRAH